ncbi:MAG: hypothetical protein CSB44_06865 [Gammaproteobacteria bacterium]|nr:MAG: hypothetical protein CSB44_06865 [Gammaproteobacteria bacterium]
MLRLSLVGLLFLGACASSDGARKGAGSAQTMTRENAIRDVRVDTDEQEVAQLWDAAERARRENNDSVALRILYEALEIDPQSPILWSRSAEIQLDNEQPAQAENFAMRSNSFAKDNRALLHRNWMIIEHARNQRGDLLGVRSAHKKVQEYQAR